jgi:hypothetical protein
VGLEKKILNNAEEGAECGFISRFSDEVLKSKVLTNLLEAKVLVEDYRSY